MAVVLSKLACSYTQPSDQCFALIVSGQHAGKFLLVLVCVSFINCLTFHLGISNFISVSWREVVGASPYFNTRIGKASSLYKSLLWKKVYQTKTWERSRWTNEPNLHSLQCDASESHLLTVIDTTSLISTWPYEMCCLSNKLPRYVLWNLNSRWSDQANIKIGFFFSCRFIPPLVIPL